MRVEIGSEYRLETVIEVIKERFEELLETFTIHWTARGLTKGFVAFEFMHLLQFKTTFDFNFG